MIKIYEDVAREMRDRVLWKTACIIVLGLFAGSSSCVYRSPSLSIEAKIIYNMGGPQPVARTHFYLLDSDPFGVRADEPGFQRRMSAAKSEEERTNLLLESAIFLLFKEAINSKKITDANAKQFLGSVDSGRSLWESHLVKEMVTDFEGRAKCEGLKAGNYWLLGMTETRAAFALWNIPIQINAGENNLLVSQGNAIYSK